MHVQKLHDLSPVSEKGNVRISIFLFPSGAFNWADNDDNKWLDEAEARSLGGSVVIVKNFLGGPPSCVFPKRLRLLLGFDIYVDE